MYFMDDKSMNRSVPNFKNILPVISKAKLDISTVNNIDQAKIKLAFDGLKEQNHPAFANVVFKNFEIPASTTEDLKAMATQIHNFRTNLSKIQRHRTNLLDKFRNNNANGMDIISTIKKDNAETENLITQIKCSLTGLRCGNYETKTHYVLETILTNLNAYIYSLIEILRNYKKITSQIDLLVIKHEPTSHSQKLETMINKHIKIIIIEELNLPNIYAESTVSKKLSTYKPSFLIASEKIDYGKIHNWKYDDEDFLSTFFPLEFKCKINQNELKNLLKAILRNNNRTLFEQYHLLFALFHANRQKLAHSKLNFYTRGKKSTDDLNKNPAIIYKITSEMIGTNCYFREFRNNLLDYCYMHSSFNIFLTLTQREYEDIPLLMLLLKLDGDSCQYKDAKGLCITKIHRLTSKYTNVCVLFYFDRKREINKMMTKSYNLSKKNHFYGSKEEFQTRFATHTHSVHDFSEKESLEKILVDITTSIPENVLKKTVMKYQFNENSDYNRQNYPKLPAKMTKILKIPPQELLDELKREYRLIEEFFLRTYGWPEKSETDTIHI